MNVIEKKKGLLASNAGFSLVELMVVVAIIGILASVGIPSLKKYISKSKQGEAKANLSALFVSEKAFNTEYNTFSTDFGAIKLVPEGPQRYVWGFKTAAMNTTALLGPYGYSGNVSGFNKNNDFSSNISFLSETKDSGGTTLVLPASSTASTTAFSAVAVSNLGQTNPDTWSMDQSKTLSNATDGL